MHKAHFIHHALRHDRFVTCSCCDKPMKAGWAKGKTKSYAYYYCFNKDCNEYTKSIRKEELEGDFDTLLASITPTQDLIAMVQAMLKKLWGIRESQAKTLATSAKREVQSTERKIEQLVERLVKADSPKII